MFIDLANNAIDVTFGEVVFCKRKAKENLE